jgi:hypothetical protein
MSPLNQKKPHHLLGADLTGLQHLTQGAMIPPTMSVTKVNAMKMAAMNRYAYILSANSLLVRSAIVHSGMNI